MISWFKRLAAPVAALAVAAESRATAVTFYTVGRRRRTSGVPLAGSVAALILASASWCSAASFVIEFATPYTNSVVPSGDGGATPYMTATFEDAGTNAVKLTLSTLGLKAPSEFVSKWFFNLDPQLNPANLKFTLDGNATTAPKEDWTFVRDANNLDLGGQAIGFDFGTLFETGANEDGAFRFNADETFVGMLSMDPAGVVELTANSFKFLNPGPPQFYGIAHVQGIDGSQGGTSTKLGGHEGGSAVPLPGPALAGLVLLGGFGLKRFRRCPQA